MLTEAEWEYAARSGTTREFWTGQGNALGGAPSALNSTNGTETILDGVSNPLLRDYAWYGGNNDNQYGAYGSKEVGQKLPNGVGLYDVHGNVYEWTTDWYGCSYPDSPTDAYCDSVGSDRVIRGGYWGDPPYDLRSAVRYHVTPTYRVHVIGFRLGLTP